MRTTSNVLNLFGEPERALMGLALRYELETGLRINWRKSERDIFEMVRASLGSASAELYDKALHFLKVLPEKGMLAKYGISQGVSCDSSTKSPGAPKKMYRGRPVY